MLLEVKDLNTYYGDSHALQGVSLEVGEGEGIIAGTLGHVWKDRHKCKANVFPYLEKIPPSNTLYKGRYIEEEPGPMRLPR